MKHMLIIDGMTEKDICEVLNLADQLKFEKHEKISHRTLRGKIIGVPGNGISDMTAAIIDIAAAELGAHAVRLPAWDSESTSRLYSRYVDCIVTESDKPDALSAFAENSDVPVINCARGEFAPFDRLAALMTVREDKGTLDGAQDACPDSLDAAENLLHVAKAVLVKSLKKN